MKHSLFLTTTFFCLSFAYSQTEIEKVNATVDQNDIKGHIYFLADDLLKGRETGTPENKIAASYLANTLRSYGVKPNPKTGTYYQEVILNKTKPSIAEVSLGGPILQENLILANTPVNFNGEMVFLNFGTEQDFSGKNLSNKLVVVKAGKEGATDARGAYMARLKKSELAKNAGAAGLVELLNVDAETWDFLEHNFKEERLEVGGGTSETKNDLPHIWVLDPAGKMAAGLTATPGKASLKMDAEIKEQIKSYNVVGVVEGTDPKLKDQYVVYSGHYDHVGIGAPDETGDTIYNGARDNAVGTTTVLSMAENLAKFPTKRSALFILFTGEEKGLLGSKYYVENPVLPLDKMVYLFNSDNAGYNDTTVATIIGLERTTAGKHIKKAATTFGITAIDDPAPEQGLFDRSDNVNFAVQGIPSPTFSLGFRAFDGDVTKYYHRPGDEPQTLDYDYLLKFFKAYVLAGRLIANDPETPFWTTGDKYEPAGKKLYNKQ